MSEQIREEFERVMPAPRYVYWDGEYQRYMSSGNPLGCIEYQGKWMGWQASRDSQPSGYTAVDMANAARDERRCIAENLIERLAVAYPDSEAMMTVECFADWLSKEMKS